MENNFMALDPWQEEIIRASGNLAICTGRQVGKSTAIAIKVKNYVTKNADKQVMIICVTEDQAYELLLKVQLALLESNKSLIKIGREKPTKTQIKLKNGSIVRTRA